MYPILPPDYTVEYDGVLAPVVSQYSVPQKKDFKSLQLFAGAGFRSDWDVSNHWRVAFDFRVNYGIFDPRTDEYTKTKIKLFLYELLANAEICLLNYPSEFHAILNLKKVIKSVRRQLKGTSRQYKPAKYPWAKPSKSKPKG